MHRQCTLHDWRNRLANTQLCWKSYNNSIETGSNFEKYMCFIMSLTCYRTHISVDLISMYMVSCSVSRWKIVVHVHIEMRGLDKHTIIYGQVIPTKDKYNNLYKIYRHIPNNARLKVALWPLLNLEINYYNPLI